jgi:hypothetical protein
VLSNVVVGGDGILYLAGAGVDTLTEMHINPTMGAIIALNVDLVFDVTATMSTATATSTVSPSGGSVEIVPINA